MFRYYIGTHVFPDVLLNDIAGPEGDPLLLSLKLSVDVLVSNGELICYWLAISARTYLKNKNNKIIKNYFLVLSQQTILHHFHLHRYIYKLYLLLLLP
jgi:hypothetical protein